MYLSQKKVFLVWFHGNVTTGEISEKEEKVGLSNNIQCEFTDASNPAGSPRL